MLVSLVLELRMTEQTGIAEKIDYCITKKGTGSPPTGTKKAPTSITLVRTTDTAVLYGTGKHLFGRLPRSFRVFDFCLGVILWECLSVSRWASTIFSNLTRDFFRTIFYFSSAFDK